MKKLLFHIVTSMFFITIFHLTFLISSLQARDKGDVVDFVNLWLIDACDLGEEGVQEKALMNYGPIAEDILIKALEKGPEESQLAEMRERLAKKWKRRQEILNSEKAAVLKHSNQKVAKSVSKEKYFTVEISSFILRYKDRAIQGMSLIGMDKSRKVLEKFISIPDFPLKDVAKNAFEKINKRLQE